MNEPLELSPNVWLDESTNTVIVGMDRMSVAFDPDDFWDFCCNIEQAKINIGSHPEFVIGEYEEDGILKTQLMLKPDDPDIN